MAKRFGLVAGLLALAFDLHAGVVPKPIAPQLPIELVQGQQEIAIDVPTTASGVGMQFGLIGALIGSAVQNSQAKGAEERVTPIRDSLIGYDFNAELEKALRQKLVSPDVSPDPQFTIITPVAIAERETNRLERPAQALVLAPRYAFDYELGTLTVRVVATLENRERKSNGKYRVRSQFRHTYAFSFPIDHADKTARPWVALGRDGLAAVLDQGIAQVSDMVAYDFSDKGRGEWDIDNRKQFVRIKDRGFPGMGIRQEPDFVWARTGKFDGQTIQGWQPLNGPIARSAVAAMAPAAEPAPMPEPQAAPATGQSALGEMQAPAAAQPADGGAANAPAGPIPATAEGG